MRRTNNNFVFLKCFFILIFFQYSLICKANEEKTITMAFGHDPAKNSQYKFYELLYTEAFGRLGYEFSYIICPLKRCSYLSNSGRVDGEPQRIFNYNEKYPNLIRVEESINVTRIIAYANTPIYNIDSWGSFNKIPYRVEYVRGALDTQLQLEKQMSVNSEQLSAITTTYQGLQRLYKNRIDIFVELESRVSRFIRTTEFSESGITEIGVIDVHPSYPFLHKKHIELALTLEGALRKLKKEGIYKRLKAESNHSQVSK